MVGIVLEQHPDRTRLFMQWKQMGWPVLIDSLNLLDLKVVPVTLLIDEAGIIRFRGSLDSLDDFLELEAPSIPAGRRVASPPPSRGALEALARGDATAEDLRRAASGWILWGGDDGPSRAISAYERALELDPGHGPTHFRLGVAHRHRYDSLRRESSDFHSAVRHWGLALDSDPNQYIWRRRIQQYGPRLSKPYPFYDWVEEARQEIRARGEEPVTLSVEPRGAEIAEPAKRFEVTAETRQRSERDQRVRRDERGFVSLESTLVPAAVEPGESVRLHLVLRPNAEIHAHWNNEAEDLRVWLDSPAGWKLERELLEVANPREAVSHEERRLEVELQAPDALRGPVTLTGYALYYVCEDVDGSCLYRRQDLSVTLPVR